MANAIGADVSFYQDDDTTPKGIDFAKMKTRADFVIIRAGQNEWVDPDFRTNWAAAKKAGLLRGSYWFYDSRVEPKLQAELWQGVLGNDSGELPLCADFEENYSGAYRGWRNWVVFLEQIKKLMPGKEIVVYTASYYWQQNAPNPATQASNLEYFHQYPLWIANYGANTPYVPAPWGESEWLFWQYSKTGKGAAFGVESADIDLNYFNGDTAALYKRFNIAGVVEPAIYKVGLNLREGADVSYAVIGTFTQDELVEKLDENSDGSWLKVKRADGQVGWSHISQLTRQATQAPLKPWAQVLTAAVNVRRGVGAQFEVVGTVKQDQIVKILQANADQSWVKILTDDAEKLQGWCDARYFTFLDAKPEPVVVPDPEPVPATWYRVNVYALNVREQAGTQYAVVGALVRNEVVERIDTDETKKWFKIKSQKGLLGWAYAAYLLETDAPLIREPDPEPLPEPTPEPPPDPEPDPPSEFLGRFQVTAFSLNVRAGDATSQSIVGRLLKGDIINAIDANADGSWRKIEKDDLVGWCSAKFLVRYP